MPKKKAGDRMAHVIDAVIQLKDNFTETIKRVEKSVGDFSRTYKNVGKNIEKTGKTISGVGKTLTTAITLPTIGMGIAATKSAIDFESAFAGVRKTVDATEKQFAELEKGIREMAKEIPSTAEEIAGVAEAAGQLGIQVDNIIGFTRVMIDLGEATNLTAEEAASSLAQFANITQMSQKDFDRLGSAIVALGNNLATTEADIVAMGMRLAGAGAQIGLSEAEIMSFAGALSSVGIAAEAGGSAFSKVMIDMQLAAETGSAKLHDYAKVAGMTAGEFANAFKEDAAGAIIAFIKGLGDAEKQGKSAIKVLDDMGIKEVRLRDTLLRAAGATGVFEDAIKLGTQAWDENMALTTEAAQRYATAASQIEIAKNKVRDIGIEIGQKLLPYVILGIDKFSEFLDMIQNLDDGTKKTIGTIIKYAVVIGPTLLVIGKLTTIIGKLIFTFGKFAGAVKKVGLIGAIFTPGVKIFLILSAIAAAVILLIRNWDKVKAKVKEVFPNIEQQIATTMEHIRNIFSGIMTFISFVWRQLVPIFSGVWVAVQNIFWVAVETIGNIIAGLIRTISGIIDFITGVFTGDWERAWQGVQDIFGGIFQGLEALVKAPLNAVIGLINGAIEGINKIKLPDWVPMIGGKELNIPLIPKLAKGTDFWKGGIVQVHERGGEIIDLPRGSRVYPHDKSVRMAREQGQREASKTVIYEKLMDKIADTVVIREEADIDKLVNAFVSKLEQVSVNMA